MMQMSDRPEFDNVPAVLRRIRETSDVVVCQPDDGPTRYFWSNGNGVFVQVPKRGTHMGEDAVERYQTMLDWGVEMEWNDLDDNGVMDYEDPRYE